jgi:NADH:ubiquinone oxidoreductase subunit E
MACGGSAVGDDRGACGGPVAAGVGAELAADPAALIEVLHQVQLREGYLAAGALHQVARELRLPLSRVFGVASFYHLFRLSPPPRHRLAVCHGTACFVNGAEQLEAVLRARFAVSEAALPSQERAASVAERSAIQSVAQPGEAEPVRDGAAPAMAATSGACPGDDGGSEPGEQGLMDGAGGWRLERSGCLGACGLHPVLCLADGSVLRLPLVPAASLVDRLVALGLPLLPQLSAPAP